MANVLLAGYPQNVGAKVEALLKIDGPNPYVAGGQTVEARACGMTYIEFIAGAGSSNGTYFTAGNCSGVATTQKLMWFVGSTGAEAGSIDLSASSTTVLVRGFL